MKAKEIRLGSTRPTWSGRGVLPENVTAMTPISFGDSKTPLFGVVHEPARGGREHGVVLCPPIGHEYIRSHWAMRQLASNLARAGFTCLRFDWFGMGDSAGEIAQASLGRWRADVSSAARELRDIGSVRRISVVGLRLGGWLAASAVEALDDIKPANLVLWDPVLDGRAYIKTLRAIDAALEVDPNRYWEPTTHVKRSRGELIGYDLGERLLAEIEGITAEAASALDGLGVCIVGPTASPDVTALSSLLGQRGIAFESTPTALDASWDSPEKVEEMLLPGDAVQRVAQYLERRVT